MATSNEGIFGNYRGRVGKLVYYQYRGKTVTRTIGERLAPASPAQLASQQAMALTMALLKPTLAFINVGFGELALETNKSQHNCAVQYNRKNAMISQLPHPAIDFSKAMFAKGSLLGALDVAVEQLSDGLQFSWATDSQMLYPRVADQVMLMAYLPDTMETIFKLYGAKRNIGFEFLPIPLPKQKQRMELYLAFVSEDRKLQSDSQYLGQINP